MGNKLRKEKKDKYDLNKNEETNEKSCGIKEYKVVFVGSSGVGTKTTLINKLFGYEFNENIQSTSSCSYSIKRVTISKNKEIILNLWDTVGQEKFRSSKKLFFINTDCFVLGYDITSKQSFDELINRWYPMIKEFNKSNLLYLIGNKRDLYLERKVKEEEAIQFAKLENLRYFEISCKTDDGIKEFWDDLVDNIKSLD